ncbi:MAG: metal ABC transporter permease, partial [Tritonibacter mobilis]|nr:metal ABC transporter permease [Tritonibacter mobilis]
LLTATLNPELAQASGINPQREQLVLTLALAVVVAVAIKVVGVLLIAAMLLIPAATARIFSTTPERMAFLAVLIGCGSVIGGMYMSFSADTPTGPTIVSTGTALFAAASVVAVIARSLRRP